MKTGYSESWLRYVRTDFTKEVTPEFAEKLDEALEWEPGSTMAILAGGKPTPKQAAGTPALSRPRSRAGGARAHVDSAPWTEPDQLGGELSESILELLERWREDLTARQFAQLTLDLVRVRESGYREGVAAARREHGQAAGSAWSPPPGGGDHA